MRVLLLVRREQYKECVQVSAAASRHTEYYTAAALALPHRGRVPKVTRDSCYYSLVLYSTRCLSGSVLPVSADISLTPRRRCSLQLVSLAGILQANSFYNLKHYTSIVNESRLG